MRLGRIRFVAGFVLAASCVSASSVAMASPYDGEWTVTIITNSGDCQPSATYPLSVVDGRLVMSSSSDVSGKVTRSGLVRASLQGAHANGQLSGNTGSGKWNGASAGVACSGRWEASRVQ